MAILTVRDVTKSYGSVRAVAGVSFAVRKGEIFALLGPNGAGKTSLVRMLLGILGPDSGDIEYCIREPRPSGPVHRNLATCRKTADL